LKIVEELLKAGQGQGSNSDSIQKQINSIKEQIFAKDKAIKTI